mgnify:CR=1 FL=1
MHITPSALGATLEDTKALKGHPVQETKAIALRGSNDHIVLALKGHIVKEPKAIALGKANHHIV